MALNSPYQNNTPAPATTTGFGVKISKPTYNVNNTSSQNLIYSSDWPSLQTAFNVTVTSQTVGNYTLNGFSQYVIPHNLGYPPLAFVWQPTQDGSSYASFDIRTIPTVDSTNVYVGYPLTDVGLSPPQTPFNVKCFSLDLSKDIDYSIQAGSSIRGGYDPNFGIKISKPNKTIYSKDLRDYVLHSRCQSPLILAVKTQATSPAANVGSGGGTVQYTNPYGTPTWNYGFVKQSNGTYEYAPYYNQSYPKTTTDGITTYITWVSASNSIGATIVVLRDPLFNATFKAVQY